MRRYSLERLPVEAPEETRTKRGRAVAEGTSSDVIKKAAELAFLCDSKVMLFFTDPDDIVYRFFSGNPTDILQFFQLANAQRTSSQYDFTLDKVGPYTLHPI